MPTEHLKLKLQQYGALRPEAWVSILACLQKTELKTGESFIRKAGTLAYLSSGLLKEYDAHSRKSPSIINFIFSNQCLITRNYNQAHYLKACLPTDIFYWDFEDLQILYQTYKELKPAYDAFCTEYDEGIAFRQLILEMPSAQIRIRLFIAQHRHILNLIKKKDMANYLSISYHHFIHSYNERL